MHWLTWFDIITVLLALIGKARGEKTFAVPSEYQDVYWDLKSAGVKVKHASWVYDPFEGEMFMFNVPGKQADYARNLMQQWGYA